MKKVNVYRGAVRGLSDHYLVEAKVTMKGLLKREIEKVKAKRVVRLSELEK